MKLFLDIKGTNTHASKRCFLHISWNKRVIQGTCRKKTNRIRHSSSIWKASSILSMPFREISISHEFRAVELFQLIITTQHSFNILDATYQHLVASRGHSMWILTAKERHTFLKCIRGIKWVTSQAQHCQIFLVTLLLLDTAVGCRRLH